MPPASPGSPAPTLVFAIFMLGRGLYGTFGSASPPAVQAYVAARTDGAARTSALAALASSFGLGTIIGPAIAPLFIFPPLGLSGAAVRLRRHRRRSCSPGSSCACPTTRRAIRRAARSSPIPSIGGADAARRASDGPRERDPPCAGAIRGSLPWHVIGIVGGHGQAACSA